MNSTNKSKPDKFKIIRGKSNEVADKQKTSKMLSTAEKMEIALPSWHDHVVARDEINSFTVIINNNMQIFSALENHVILPFEEFHGDYSMNWVIVWDYVEKKEVFRRNTRMIDLVDWVIKPDTKKDESSKV